MCQELQRGNRPQAVWIHLKKSVIEKSKSAQHVLWVIWDEARILGVEGNSRYREYRVC
jgi:hypothetical protein